MDYVYYTLQLAVLSNFFFKWAHFLKGSINHSLKAPLQKPVAEFIQFTLHARIQA